VEFTEMRGVKGIREATVKIKDMDVKIGIAHELGNARKLPQDIREGQSVYHAIEIMVCPGGCQAIQNVVNQGKVEKQVG
jgi:NADH-quinone oxidoreductase subunit G